MAEAERIERIRMGLQLRGLKVVDGCYISASDDISRVWDLRLSYEYRKGVVGREYDAYAQIEDIISGSERIVFPQEVRDEMQDLTCRIKRWAKHTKAATQKRTRGRASNVENFLVNPARRQEMLDFASLLNRLHSRRKAYVEQIFKGRDAGSLLCPDQRQILPRIQCAVREMVLAGGVLKSPNNGAFEGHSEGEHMYHDSGIFAMALTLSYAEPVRLLTRDSDFVRLSRNCHIRQDLLKEKYCFEWPQHQVDIVYMHTDGIKVFRPDPEGFMQSSLEVR